MPKFRKAPECLFDIVEEVIDRLGIEDRLMVEIDCPSNIGIPGPLKPTTDLVEALVAQASRQMEDAGELTVIAWESADVCELEVSDSGADIEHRDCSAPIACTLAGADLIWQNCPQGGAAVTARFEKRLSQRKAA